MLSIHDGHISLKVGKDLKDGKAQLYLDDGSKCITIHLDMQSWMATQAYMETLFLKEEEKEREMKEYRKC
jgi:hypothetical protein